MGLFKSKYEKELDGIIADINMNMNNNYKDNAQAGLRRFDERLEELLLQGLLRRKLPENIKDSFLPLRRRHTRLLPVTGVLTCALPIYKDQLKNWG